MFMKIETFTKNKFGCASTVPVFSDAPLCQVKSLPDLDGFEKLHNSDLETHN